MTKTMKQFIALLAISSVLWSCGGGGDDPPPPPVNSAPTTPTLVEPLDGSLCIGIKEDTGYFVDFQWNASTDPENNTITYQIEVAENSAFTEDKQTIDTGQLTTQVISLEEDIAYYWRVKATDGEDSSSYSSVYKFYTYGEGVTNRLPFSPELVNPVLNAVPPTTTLEWTASDVDNDPLTFDVFFGTDPESVKEIVRIYDEAQQKDIIDDDDYLSDVTVEQDQTDPNKIIYSIVDIPINSSTRYYWKVVVKDDKGGETIGQIWNFQTD